MKKLLEIFILLQITIFSSCNITNENEPQLVDPDTLNISIEKPIIYKKDDSNAVTLKIHINKGPAVNYIIFYKLFQTFDWISTDSRQLQILSILGANNYNDVDTSLNITYSDLSNELMLFGNPLPVDDDWLHGGDSWRISCRAVMYKGDPLFFENYADIFVANFFSRRYNDSIVYYNPGTGTLTEHEYYNLTKDDSVQQPMENQVLYVTMNKEFIPLSDSACQMDTGIWKDLAGAGPVLKIMPDNTIQINYVEHEGSPNDPSIISHYDPNTGKLYLYYYWHGQEVPGLYYFEETLTPQ